MIYRSGTRDQFTSPAFYSTNVNPIFYELRDELDPDDKAEIHRQISIEKAPELLDPQQLVQSQAVETNPYVFYKPNVFSAVVSQAINQTNETYTPWMDLPADVATQISRDMISRQMYDHIYEPTELDQYPISKIRQQFFRRVRNQGVLNYQFVRIFQERINKETTTIFKSFCFNQNNYLVTTQGATNASRIFKCVRISVTVQHT